MDGARGTILDGLERNAGRFAERTALIHRDERVSYAQLWQRVTAVASFLRGQGLQPGDRVALILDSSPEYVAAYYGAMAAGCVAVPLNSAAKARDLDVWIKHSGARRVLTQSSQPERSHLATDGAAIHCLDSLAEAAESSTAVSSKPSLTAPACILYTSGTTGAPKGVLLTHANLAANGAAIVRYLALTEQDSIVCVLPFHYSYGSSVLHTHLLAGGCVIIETNLVYPHVVMEALARHRASGFAGVPSTFALLLSRVALEKYELSSLRYATQAGGAMAPALAQRLRQALPATTRLFVMYGQTEATARLTYLPPEDLERKPGSVGKALEGVSLEVRSEDGRRCEPLQGGEVWARGPNVMAGYWNDAATTATVLREGWLRTGDMGYLDTEGYLFLAGRRSDMIKAGAHRIHPKDVEEAIQELEGVAEAAVVGIDDEILGQAIKAFVVPAPGHHLDPLRIKAHCRERLAQYKIPKYVELIERLPKTASGKIRRHELVQEP